jgi:hypothetical protein
MVKALKLSEQEVREQGKRFRERLLEVLLSKDQVSQLMLQREKVMTANTNNTTATNTRTPDLHHSNISSNVINSSNSNPLNSNGSSSMAQILEVHPAGSTNNPIQDNNYQGNNNTSNSSRSSSKSNNIIIDPSSPSSFSENGADTSSKK